MQQSANKAITAGWAIFIMVLSNFMASPACAQQNLQWHSFEDAIAIADSTQRPIFVDVWAPWCGWCRKMKREVYPELKQQLRSSFVLTRINRNDTQTTHRYNGNKLSSLKLAQQLKTRSVPAMVLLNAKGEYILQLSGFMEAVKLKPVLGYIRSGAYRSMRFENFKEQQEL